MELSTKTQALQIEEHQYERRRRKRLFLSFPIEISGIDRTGQKFMERTKTEDISESGCRLHCKKALRCGDFLDLKLVPPPAVNATDGTCMRFKIVWVAPADGGWEIGVQKVDKDKMWKVTFPHNR